MQLQQQSNSNEEFDSTEELGPSVSAGFCWQ